MKAARRRSAADFAGRLLAWYDAHRRVLPWRRPVPDAWQTWVSEVMLQQTRVDVVAAVFDGFIDRYPDPASFARAGDDELLAAWQGLGYYRRARLLREGARQVVARHDGRVPADPAALAELAGVGRYTQGAIASIAFGAVQAAIDGNVERVFARHAALTDEVKQAATQRHLRARVLARIDRRRPGDFNPALMDLGATVCTPRNPACEHCPVAADCEARRLGLTRELPRLPPRRATIAIRAAAVLITDATGRSRASRIPDGEVNSGQLELPGPGVLVDVGDDRRALLAALRTRHGLRCQLGEPLLTIRHTITQHRIVLTLHRATLRGTPPPGLRFVDAQSVWSTPSRKALAGAQALPPR